MANLGVSMKEVIPVISDIGKSHSYVQGKNNLDFLIWEDQLPNLKRHWILNKYQ